jgi:hypothetical protein
MDRNVNTRAAVVLATMLLAGCAGRQAFNGAAAIPARRAAMPSHSAIPVLQPLDLEKTDYRFRMIGGPYKVTSSNSSVDVVVNKHGVDPDQIDIQPSRTGPNVGRAVITVTNEHTGAAFEFTVLVQK